MLPFKVHFGAPCAAIGCCSIDLRRCRHDVGHTLLRDFRVWPMNRTSLMASLTSERRAPMDLLLARSDVLSIYTPPAAWIGGVREMLSGHSLSQFLHVDCCQRSSMCLGIFKTKHTRPQCSATSVQHSFVGNAAWLVQSDIHRLRQWEYYLAAVLHGQLPASSRKPPGLEQRRLASQCFPADISPTELAISCFGQGACCSSMI